MHNGYTSKSRSKHAPDRVADPDHPGVPCCGTGPSWAISQTTPHCSPGERFPDLSLPRTLVCRRGTYRRADVQPSGSVDLDEVGPRASSTPTRSFRPPTAGDHREYAARTSGLQDRVLAAVGAEHRDHDYRAVHVGGPGHELRLGAIDGSVTRVPDGPANREAFGSTGTADDSAPYPQVRDLLATDASTRGDLAVVSGPSGGPKAKASRRCGYEAHPGTPACSLMTACGSWNFRGADRVSRMLATGTHVLIRVKSDIALPRTGSFLPDGSYCS
jgi:hypothetical protein